MKKYRLQMCFIIVSLFIAFIIIIWPNRYLGKYKDTVNIDFDFNDEGYFYKYDLNNDNLLLYFSEDKFVLRPNKDGISHLIIYYLKDENDLDNYKYKIEYDFKVDGTNIYWTDGVGYGLFDYPNPY